MWLSRVLPEDVSTALHAVPVSRERWTEIRLRCRGISSVTVGGGGSVPVPDIRIDEGRMAAILMRICGGSIHAYDRELRRGYLTPHGAGGLRVGVSGSVLSDGERILRLRSAHSLCFRIPHAVPGDTNFLRRLVCGDIPPMSVPPVGSTNMNDALPSIPSTLFYAPPGGGKTTLLRQVTRALTAAADGRPTYRVAVIDTGGELDDGTFSDCTADFFEGYPRAEGMLLALRAFSPDVILCDEIGSPGEAEAFLQVQAGGASILASAHGEDLAALLRRPALAMLHSARVFDRYIRIAPGKDGTFHFSEETAPCG